jgi:hypothetical protein
MLRIGFFPPSISCLPLPGKYQHSTVTETADFLGALLLFVFLGKLLVDLEGQAVRARGRVVIIVSHQQLFLGHFGEDFPSIFLKFKNLKWAIW